MVWMWSGNTKVLQYLMILFYIKHTKKLKTTKALIKKRNTETTNNNKVKTGEKLWMKLRDMK